MPLYIHLTSLDKYKEANLLKPSILKSSIATVEKDFIIYRLGSLIQEDREQLDKFLNDICW